MTQQPYPLSGFIKETDNSSVVSSSITVTVKLHNKRLGKSTTGTYNPTTGAYIVDAANIVGDYIDGDNITVDVTAANRVVQYRTTINTTNGFEEKNLTFIYNDIIGLLVNILSDNWDRSTTDSIKPLIKNITEEKIPDLENNDYVLLYEINETKDSFAIGGNAWQQKPVTSLDIRTTFKNEGLNDQTDVRVHGIKMRTEVERIINSIVGGTANFIRFLHIRTRDLSDKSRGQSRFVMDVEPTRIKAS